MQHIIYSQWYDMLCRIFISTFSFFFFFRNIQADLCACSQILVHHYHRKLISRIQRGHISHAWTFLFAGFCLASFSQERNSLCCRRRASRSPSQLAIRAKLVHHRSKKRHPNRQGPSKPTHLSIYASSGVYGNLPYVCVKPFCTSQCAPQNCQRPSKWALGLHANVCNRGNPWLPNRTCSAFAMRKESKRAKLLLRY